MEEYDQIRQMRWYQKWWGVILIVVVAAILLLIIFVGAVIGRHYWLIKKGGINYLKQNYYGNFSQATSSSSNLGAKVKRAELETSDDPFLGNPAGQLVVVEFIDFKCPNCKSSNDIMKKLMTKYAYKIKLIKRDFPVESTHPGASKLAELAYCAQQQWRYWEMHDLLFDNQSSLTASLTEADIKNLAAKASLDSNKLQECLNSGSATIEVNKDYTDGFKFGVKGTPTFFINGQKVEGVVPLDSWEKLVKEFK